VVGAGRSGDVGRARTEALVVWLRPLNTQHLGRCSGRQIARSSVTAIAESVR
jgi:hypothetical protein